MSDVKNPPETEKRVVLPVDPTRRTEIDKQRVPMSARPYRLLALVKQDAVVRVQKEPDDTVMTWPHLLTNFHPAVAGVLVPTFVLVGAALIPYIDRENILAVRPSERKTAVMLFTMFCCLGLIVTFVGIFFRGPGYTFVIPYVTSPGLHFAL